MSQFIQDFRAKYPQYQDVADDQLVSALHTKYYSDIPIEQFNQRIGYQAPAPKPIQKQPVDLQDVEVDGFTGAARKVEPEQPGIIESAWDQKEQRKAAFNQQVQELKQINPAWTDDQIYEAAQQGKTPDDIAFERRMLEEQKPPEQQSMMELVGSKLANWGKGAGERAGDVGGALLQTIETVGSGLEKKFPMGGLVWEDGDILPSVLGPEEWAKREAEPILTKGADVLKGIDLGYQEQVGWEDVKKSFSEGGPLSASAYADVLEYGLEQGIKSVPDMVSAIYALPAYVFARSGEIGEQRAQNKGKQEAELEDVLEAAPFAVAASLLERIGAKGITQAGKEELGKEILKAGLRESAKRSAKAGGKALSKDAATEAIQEGMIEYVGERYGTDVAMDWKEALDRAAAGAVAGGVFGGAGGTSTAVVNEINYSPEKVIAQAMEEEIAKAEPTAVEQQVIDLLKPERAQVQQEPKPKEKQQVTPKEPEQKTDSKQEVKPEQVVQEEFEIDKAEPQQPEPVAFDVPVEGEQDARVVEDSVPEQRDQQERGIAVDEAQRAGREVEPERVDVAAEPARSGEQVAPVGTAVTEPTPTLEHKGIKVNVPELSQEVVDGYNRSTHLGKGRDLNQEQKDTAKAIIDDLEGSKFVLDTPEQKAEAAALIDRHMAKVADFNRWNAQQAINNPSWLVTGRSGRNMAKANAKAERTMNEYTKRVDAIERDRKAIKRKLYEMRPAEVKQKQQQTKNMKDIADYVGQVSTYLQEGKQAVAKDNRKWAIPKALKAVEASLESDRAGTIEFLKKMDEKLSDLGGFVKVVGPRSKLGKLYFELSREPEVKADEQPQAKPEEKAAPAQPEKKPEAKTEQPEAAVSDYGTSAAKSFASFRESVANQTATAEQIKSDAENLIANKEKVIAQLSDRKFTKAMLQEIIRSPRSDLKKPQMVKQAYEQMLSAHVMGDATFTIFGGSKSFEEQIIEKVNKQTQADVDAAYEKQREYRAKMEQRKEQFVKALTNPETLPEFKEFIRVRGKDKMSPEQLAKYDELVTESLRPEDKPKVVEGEAEVIKTERAETKHSKTGEDLFVVKLVDRVGREQFNDLRGKAKQFGGYYSTYAKQGAIPGFQFKSKDAADQFDQLLKGKDVRKSDFEEAKAEVKQSKNADRLLEMADKLEAKAEAEINRPRETNTARRASMAANATERAYKQLALAKTVRNIGNALQDGDLVHLGKINQVTQLEELMSIQRRAIPNDLFESSYDGYSMNYELKPDVTIDDYIANVTMPEITINQDRAMRFSRDLEGKRGFMRLAAELRRLPAGKGENRILSEEQASKIQEAVKKGHVDSYTLGFIPDAQKSIGRLNRIGITTDEQLRAAIRELDSLRVEKQKEDPLKKMERDLVGKKIAGYFPTPKPLVDQMIDYADIEPGHQVLEPSAGKGNIADQVKAAAPDAELDVIEVNSGLQAILEAKGYNVVADDFLDYKGKQYDRIVMNPPFENFQDIEHVRHAYDLLKPGGKLVAIMGAGVKNSRKKSVEFREWLDDMGSYIEDLPSGSFKSSDRPTGVETVMVTIEKNDTNTLNYKKGDNKKGTEPKSGERVFHAPGHNFIGLFRSTGIPERREFVTIEGRKVKIPKKPQRIEPIMRKLVKIAGRRIYFGKIKGKSQEGFYRPNVGEIRTRRKNDVEVLAHELAHYLDVYSNITLPNFQKLYKDPKFVSEVEALSYTDADPKIQKIEGFAEFVRLWLTNANEAQNRAPKFYEAFTNTLARDRKLLNPMRDMQDLMHKFYFQGPDKLGQALIGKDTSFIQAFDEWKYRRDSRIRQQVIDRFHAARKVEQELTRKVGTVQESAWKQFRLANGGAEGISDYIMNYGTVQFDEKGDLKRNGASLHEVLVPVKTIKLQPDHEGEAKIDLLMRYFAGRRALELHRQKRENLIPKETAKEWARLGSTYPVFESIHKEYQAFNDRMMDFYQEAGMITPEGRKAMQSMNKDYVPFNRIRDQLAGGSTATTGFKKLKGGTANLNDILVNIQDGVTANVRAALNNRAKQRLYQYISGHKDGAIFATKIAPDSRKVQVYADEMQAKIGKVLEMNGIELEGDLDLATKGLLEFWQHGVTPKVNESGNIVDSVIINGKPKYYEVQDPLLQEMLLSMNPESYSSFMNVMFGVKNFFTRMITLGVEFTGANLVRDTTGAAFLSKNNFKPFVDSFKGMYSFITKDQYYQDFLRSGGGYSSRLEATTKEGTARRRVAVDEFGIMTIPERLLSSIDNIASAFEYGTRIGEFRLAKKNMKSDMDAGFDAREISTDFSVLGANRFLTGYIRTVPFLNAMIQSQDRVFREAVVSKRYDGNPTALAMKAFLGITVPTLILYLVNKDDEDYQQIPDYEKRTNWHIKIGDGQFIKIPRPYDVGFVYATMPELFAKYVEDDKGKEFADGMIWTLTQMYGIDGTPAMMTGWWDLVRNEKWTGAPVVPQSLSNVEAPEQYTSNTSETFVRMGEALGVSPIKAEHMFKAYTGYLGGYLLWGTDHMLWDEEKFGEKPDRKVSDNVFLRRFLTPDVRPGTAAMEKFFDIKEQSDRVVATFRQTVDVRRQIAQRGEQPGKFKDDRFFGLSAKEKEVLFALNDSMNQLIKLMYGKEGIKTAELKIKYDAKLSGAEKREQLDQLWLSRNKAFMQYYQQANQALQKAKREAKREK